MRNQTQTGSQLVAAHQRTATAQDTVNSHRKEGAPAEVAGTAWADTATGGLTKETTTEGPMLMVTSVRTQEAATAAPAEEIEATVAGTEAAAVPAEAATGEEAAEKAQRATGTWWQQSWSVRHKRRRGSSSC